MTSSLYFLPPTSSPPWLLISSKMSSIACLWGIPHGAAGPERGVETPNLMTSAAGAIPGLATTRTAAAKRAIRIRGNRCVIAIPPVSIGSAPIARNYRDAGPPLSITRPLTRIEREGRRSAASLGLTTPTRRRSIGPLLDSPALGPRRGDIADFRDPHSAEGVER